MATRFPNNRRDIDFIVEGLLRFTGREMVELATDLSRSLEDHTPKDTTLASHGWFLTVGSPVLVDEPWMGRAARAERVPGATQLQQTSRSELVAYRVEHGSIFLINNFPHIVRLNEGSSAQAGRAFVQSDIEAAILKRGG